MGFKGKDFLLIIHLVIGVIFYSQQAHAMHIAEGFLPVKWAIGWWLVILPFIAIGVKKLNRLVEGKGAIIKILFAVAGAFVFVLSSLKLPSLTGSCSHPTGIGLGAILFGPWPMVVLGCIVLLFQAVLLAHGGLTTLGANLFAMAIVGSFVAYGVYKIVRKLGGPLWLAIFLGATLGDLMTYITTASQLAIVFPSDQGGVLMALSKFMSVFTLTQIPLAIVEGLLTVLVFNMIYQYSHNELKELSIISRGEII